MTANKKESLTIQDLNPGPIDLPAVTKIVSGIQVP